MLGRSLAIPSVRFVCAVFMRAAAATAAGALLLIPAPAPAAVLAPGDIVVTRVNFEDDELRGEVLKVDPLTGASTPISTGGPLRSPVDVALRPDGLMYVVGGAVDASQGGLPISAIFRVDPATGAQTLVLSEASPGAPTPVHYGKAQFDAAGNLIAVASWDRLATGRVLRGGIIRLDPVTNTASRVDMPGTLRSPLGLAIDASGNILTTNFEDRDVAPFQPNAVISTNPATGAATNLAARQPGQALLGRDIVVGPNGRVILGINDQISSVDPATGQLTTVSSGGLLQSVQGLALDPLGRLLVVDELSGLVAVNLATGAQTPLATGPEFVGLSGITVVPVPEPSSLALVALTGCALCSRRRPGPRPDTAASSSPTRAAWS